jgi:hypothetical protein
MFAIIEPPKPVLDKSLASELPFVFIGEAPLQIGNLPRDMK